MTVVADDRTDMAEERDDERTLDSMFEWLEDLPLPEGFKTEIVEGNIYFTRQRRTHWRMILQIIEQLRERFPQERLLSDVRVDFPGHLNGFASDVLALREDAPKDTKGNLLFVGVEFVAEVISKETVANDYGPKKDAYAAAGVPVYLIVDPYSGECHVFRNAVNGVYGSKLSVLFGTDIDLTDTPVGLVLHTGEFPRD
ncbi:Uma2 family endonuclease [Streptomyces sp. NPDC052052]|uniref:Uma2 family endonuclease n=1 Tax=Streptomyces sp. NPDC052052 TaxID=3154756 RepID=UPI0034350DAC